MAEIIQLTPNPRSGTSVRDIRNEYGITVVQAAKALGTSPSMIEMWEAHPDMGPHEEVARAKIGRYVVEHGRDGGKNLLFGAYPLRLAREILGLDIKGMASAYGYTIAAWQKIEANTRILDREKIYEIENRVREHFVSVCNSA